MSSDGKRILLIDDDPDMHDAVRLILEPAGYQVTCCLTGPAGLEALRRSKPDLLLLDIMLASPSEGFHLAYEVKQDELLKDVPIIMISSIGQTMGMDFGKELGSDYVQADLFLEKPLDAKALRAAVEKVLSGGD
ncbi:MAG: response regulator [Planctomycetes bacterium]|nr:response regulator [Planctomycetota bacterium]